MTPRVKTALIAGFGFLAVLLLGGVTIFAVLVGVLSMVGIWEYLSLTAPEDESAESPWVVIWGGVIVLAFLSESRILPGLSLALGVIAYLSCMVIGPGPQANTLSRWGRVAGGWLLVAFLLGHAVWIRRFGIGAVLFPLFVVWAGDTAAYYVGSAIGRRPLAPRVSPNKSIEGAIASLAAAGIVAYASSFVLPLKHGPGGSLCLGLVLNLFAQMGDLIESLLKRCVGSKDSGHLFPGHGGLLDRLDALLPVIPVYAGYLILWGG